MARQARVKEAFGTYYITQKSSGCRPLFMDNEDRDYFIGILQKTVNKFNCKVLEYCAQSDDIYHLIIDVNGGDLSKIMKSINIPYAMHAVCEGKLFKDRYKSTPITNTQELEDVRENIRACMDVDGGYNSFCSSEITPCNDSIESTCTECLSTVDQVNAKIDEVAKQSMVTPEAFLKDKEQRNILIKEIRQNSTLSLKSIGQVFGGLSESTVCKILNQ